MGRSKGKAGGSRPDRRFKNVRHAPQVVSEKRMTFFLPETGFRELRLHAGYFQVANIEANEVDDPAPESPSALVREAVDYWLDQFRNASDRARTPEAWTKRFAALRKALKNKR